MGNASIRFTTSGGFDTKVSHPRGFLARWNVSAYDSLTLWAYAENIHGFQEGSPWVRLLNDAANYAEYALYENGDRRDPLNDAIGQWQRWALPIAGSPDPDNGWRRTNVGSPDLSQVHSLEIHADTWDFGFTLWLDGVGFVPAQTAGVPAATAS